MSIRNFGVFGLAVAVSLAACTGNGPTPTDDTGGGGGGTPTAVVTSVALVPSSTSLPANADGTSGGAPGITLTAIALDASNNVVANAPLTFKVCAPDTALSDTDCNDVLSTRGGAPAAVISAPGSVTGSDGTLSATMTTGGNAELGVLNVIASSGSIDSSILKISVVSATAGTSTNSATADFLTVTASSKRLPNDASTAAQGVVINAFVTDAARNAIAGVPVSFSATSGQLIITDNKSDATGKVSAILTTGGDSTSRCIAVTVTAPQTSNATALSNNLPTGTTSELLCPSSGTQTGIQVVAISSGSPVANTLTLLTSSPQLSSSAAQTTNGVTLTAIVRDANNNVLPGVVVTFSTPNSGAITVTQAVTDSNGQALAVLTTGGDQQNRSITVTAGTGAVSDNVTINVVGTTLAISGPTTVQSGVSTTYTAILLNSSGSPISNKVVQFSYSGTGTFSPVNGQATTNSSGQATVTLTASVSGTLSASALTGTATASQDITASTDCFVFTSPTTNQQVNIGSNATITIHWTTGGCGGAVVADGTTVNFSTTRGTLSALTDTTAGGDATVTVSSAQAGFATLIASSNSGSSPIVTRTIEFVATTPASVSVQASPATIGTNQQSTVTATVLDVTNNLVKNALVQFTLTDTTGGTLSAGQATTNSQGRAQVTYSATSTPSSAGGVSIKGTVISVNGTPVTQVNGTTTITVGGAALHITLGTGNDMGEEGPASGPTTYVMPWRIQVTDSGGNPAVNADVSLSIHAMLYRKGVSEFFSPGGWVRTDGAGGAPEDCTNEDLLTGSAFDLNGFLDPGEDFNGDGLLQPGGTIQVPTTVTLDANGAADFEVRYPKSEAYWIRARLRAIASVSGTESISQTFFDLPGLAADFTAATTSPPGFESPHGVLQDCAHEPVANFNKTTQSVFDGETLKTFVQLNTPAGLNSITIPFTVTATAGELQGTDFTVTKPASCTTSSCSITIPAGGSSAEIDVALTNAAVDGDTVTLTLGTPSSQAVLGSSAVNTIVLNEGVVAFQTASDAIVAGTTSPLGVKVTLDHAVSSTVTVPFTISGTAVEDTDYTATPGTAGAHSVSFPAGATSATITITPSASATPDTTVILTLGTPTGPATAGNTTTHITAFTN